LIEKFFKNLTEINGIEAFAVLNNNNHIVDSWIESRYDLSIFNEVGLSYLQIFDIQENKNFDTSEIVLLFDKGLIFVRYHQKFFIIVIANPNVDVSHIRLAVNVGIFELDESRKFQKLLKKFPSERPRLFNQSDLDDAERLMVEQIIESKDTDGSPE
jgi:hypothetical protein